MDDTKKTTVGDMDEIVTADDMQQLLKDIPQKNQSHTDEIKTDQVQYAIVDGVTKRIDTEQPQSFEEMEEKAEENLNAFVEHGEKILQQGAIVHELAEEEFGATPPSDDAVELPDDVSGKEEMNEKIEAFDGDTHEHSWMSPEATDYQICDCGETKAKDDGIVRDEKGRIVKPVPQKTNKNGNAGRPTVMTEQILQKLETAFLMGCSDREACLFAGIGNVTLYNYQKENPEYVKQKEIWKENPILKARATIYKALDDSRIAAWYLERKKKDEFSTRQEMTGGGEDTAPIRLEYVAPSTTNTTDGKSSQS